jgi:hypothetical protein
MIEDKMSSALRLNHSTMLQLLAAGTFATLYSSFEELTSQQSAVQSSTITLTVS